MHSKKGIKFPRLRSEYYKQLVLIGFTIILLSGSLILTHGQQPSAQAANPGAGNVCSWYNVRWGDTLGGIARSYNSTVAKLAQANYIPNVNLIYVGQQICIPQPAGNPGTSNNPSLGLLPNGSVRWYAYNALEWSSRSQVNTILRQAAAHFGLPAKLVLAIAWQESGWTQHVIAFDGGIGVMQLMPLTAQGINLSTGIRRDPYLLVDNIYLGVQYLSYQWNSFHGDLTKVISAYNEGGWAVIHKGIFNWRYVNSVLAIMKTIN